MIQRKTFGAKSQLQDLIHRLVCGAGATVYVLCPWLCDLLTFHDLLPEEEKNPTIFGL